MSEHSVEEVREAASATIGKVRGMLTAYADILEQIEQTREGVTDAVVQKFIGAFARNKGLRLLFKEDLEDCRAALQAVTHLLPKVGHTGNAESVLLPFSPYLVFQWKTPTEHHSWTAYTEQQMRDYAAAHLLPSGERAVAEGIGEVSKECVHDLRKHAKQCYNLPKLADDLRRMANRIERKMASAAHPPAQAAQVDALKAMKASPEHQVDMLIARATVSGVVVPEAPAAEPLDLADIVRLLVNRHPVAAVVREMEAQAPGIRGAFTPLAPAAEPVAQGEVVAFFYIDKHTAGAIANPMTPSRDGVRAYRPQFPLPDGEFVPVYLQAAQPRAVPDGWVLVPREPTPEMLDSALRIHGDGAFFAKAPSLVSALIKIHKAMLAAAPSPGESTTTGAIGENGK
jgi:hypothetical protein